MSPASQPGPVPTSEKLPGRHPGYGSGAEVWLFRHGQVHADWHGLAYGGLDVPLSERGERDTESIARAFAAVPFRGIVSSTLKRAERLARELEQHTRAPLTLDAGLAEIQRGAWQGRPVAELFERFEDQVAGFYDDPWRYDAHGGETDRNVLERAWPVLERALGEHGGPLAVCCHYNVVRVLVAHALGIAPPDSFRLRIDLSGATLLRDDPEHGWRLLRANVKSPGSGRLAP